jgi:hypothetical protein
MLRFIGRESKRMIGGYISSDSEVKVDLTRKGIVVRCIPTNLSVEELQQKLKVHFGVDSIEVKKDFLGKPAFGIVHCEESKSLSDLMSLNKKPLDGKKLNLIVRYN